MGESSDRGSVSHGPGCSNQVRNMSRELMVIVLEATAGPIARRKIEILPGATLRIGRAAKSDYAIGEDSYLSSLHFSVACDGAQCRIRDLGSSNGTFVNGDRIADRIARQGDSVAAGGSTFVVHLEPSAPVADALRSP